MLPAIAGFAASAASQLLSSLLSALDPTTSTSSASSTSSSSTSGNATFACGDDTDASSPDNSLTGSTQGQLSGQVLMTLIAMQQQSDAASGTTATAASSASGTTSNSPLDQLFSAMDANGDGSVSQNEMESYIENVGGTQAQADSLFSALSGSSSASGSTTSTAGISESQMQNALQQSNPFSGMGHHHLHHHGMSASNGDPADQVANNLIQAMDTNDDGSVSEDELTSFVTANGGSTSDAQSDFASLDTSGSGSLTSADFAKAWENWQAQQSSQSSGAMMVSLLDNFAKASGATATAATTSVSA
ncbi:MAG TPA: EF-hand domain-containing protein [Rhizomicrobium sp.]|jgi:Ca2+-binding EF-hand superfamily protein|nr:EF-hand domain-containing protein [Rhizomicrobium sp.]